MKKVLRFTALMCALLMLAPIVSASELVVVKQYKTTYVLEIENYNDQSMYVLATAIVDAKITDPLIKNLPKAAQNIAVRKEDGMFNTITNRLEKQLAAEKEKNKQLVQAQKQRESETIWLIITLGTVIAILLTCLLFSTRPSKELKNKKTKKEKDPGNYDIIG